MNSKVICTVVGTILLLCGTAQAQHLWWDTKKLNDATCLYGEITVLATHHAIYYCGANWRPANLRAGTAASSTTARRNAAPSSPSGTRRGNSIRV